MRIALPTLLFCLLVAPSAQAADALDVAKKLPVSSEQNSGYSRDLFNHWLDLDGDGCDARDEVLLRQDRSKAPYCNAERGKWFSLYDGLFLTQSSDLDVDHFVPLAEAWGSGANRWRERTRKLFANDLYGYSLLAVSASSNRSKSDSDPSEWLPSRKTFRCTYLARWAAVKYRWRLSIDSKEKASLGRLLRSCPQEERKVTKLKRAKVLLKKPGGGSSKLDPRFPTCSAAKSAGYGPYYRGKDPEYKWYRDADGDGVVCE